VASHLSVMAGQNVAIASTQFQNAGILQHIVTQHTLFMDLVNRHRPHRAVVRCKAKMQLMEATVDCFNWDQPFDETLFGELATDLFQSSQYQIFFERCHSKQEVQDVEDRLAQDLANTYMSILKRHQDPVVQSLNALL
jgi:hypothetical protein